jgi:hypothetical protein
MSEGRDPSLDTLLDLDGQVLVVDPEGGHWVKFVVTRVPVQPKSRMASTTRSRFTGPRANGWSASTTPIGRPRQAQRADGSSPQAPGREAIRYQDAATLLADFWQLVDAVLKERGVI